MLCDWLRTANGRSELDERPVHVRVADADDRGRLVDVDLQDHLPALRPDVRGLDHVVRAEAALDVEVPLPRVGVAEVDVEDRARCTRGRRGSD